jgi:hypothetical protein
MLATRLLVQLLGAPLWLAWCLWEAWKGRGA